MLGRRVAALASRRSSYHPSYRGSRPTPIQILSPARESGGSRAAAQTQLNVMLLVRQTARRRRKIVASPRILVFAVADPASPVTYDYGSLGAPHTLPGPDLESELKRSVCRQLVAGPRNHEGRGVSGRSRR